MLHKEVPKVIKHAGNTVANKTTQLKLLILNNNIFKNLLMKNFTSMSLFSKVKIMDYIHLSRFFKKNMHLNIVLVAQ